VTTGALSQHVGAATAYERTDVTQLAEEHITYDVAPKPHRNRVLGEQALVADHDIVLREFGAKWRTDGHVDHVSKLGEA